MAARSSKRRLRFSSTKLAPALPCWPQIGFTCLRCNARTYKPINPLSFEEGTLVVQCGKCQCWHKVMHGCRVCLNLVCSSCAYYLSHRIDIACDAVCRRFATTCTFSMTCKATCSSGKAVLLIALLVA